MLNDSTWLYKRHVLVANLQCKLLHFVRATSFPQSSFCTLYIKAATPSGPFFIPPHVATSTTTPRVLPLHTRSTLPAPKEPLYDRTLPGLHPCSLHLQYSKDTHFLHIQRHQPCLPKRPLLLRPTPSFAVSGPGGLRDLVNGTLLEGNHQLHTRR